MDTQSEKQRQARALKLWVVLARTYDAVRERTHQDIARHGLTPTEFAILEVLYHKGPLLLNEVRAKILVSSGGVTYLVDRLEARGLVERRRCPNDRRATYAAATPEGEALIARIFPEHRQVVEEAVAGLDAEEQETALDLLRRLGKHAAALEGAAVEA
ncbi:MAG TPA: MarR family transcriptional regulator [Longimicrobium sp.]|nr:MarR family transcriptional regulator [Longimicrobium sp.]